jgi:hypothetical protein
MLAKHKVGSSTLLTRSIFEAPDSSGAFLLLVAVAVHSGRSLTRTSRIADRQLARLARLDDKCRRRIPFARTPEFALLSGAIYDFARNENPTTRLL